MTSFRMPRELGGLTALLILAAMVTVGCSASGGTSAPSEQSGEAEAPHVSPGSETKAPISLTRLDNGKGGVTVEATWVTPAHLQEMGQVPTGNFTTEQYVLVHLTLDTHSVDLSRYDMTRLATLSGLDDTASLPAAGWIGVQEDSHHREGLLAFPDGSNGQWEAKEKMAELTLKGIGGVAERDYVWEFVQFCQDCGTRMVMPPGHQGHMAENGGMMSGMMNGQHGSMGSHMAGQGGMMGGMMNGQPAQGMMGW